MSDEDPEEFDLSLDDEDGSADDVDPEAAFTGAEDAEADPFADTDGDADDDPFADLDGTDGDGDADDDPFADIEGVEVEDDPFSDFDVEGDGAEGDSENTLFTEMEVSEMGDDEVWSQLDDDSTAEPGGSEPDPAADLGPEGTEEASEERVVQKRAYCEQCEYFSEPPDVSCTYPSAEIVELIDTERFRVRNCPIVERRENSEISAIAGGSGDEPELEPGDPTAAADSGSDD